MALLASILIINPANDIMAAVQNIPAIPITNVAIPPIDLRPPVQRANEVRPIKVYQVLEIWNY